MCNKHSIATKFQEIWKCFVYRWCISNHFIINTCKFLYIIRYWPAWVYKCTKLICNYIIYHPHSTYFYYFITCGTNTCCFQVKYNKFTCKVLSFTIYNCIYKVIYKISLNTIYNLNVITRL